MFSPEIFLANKFCCRSHFLNPRIFSTSNAELVPGALPAGKHKNAGRLILNNQPESVAVDIHNFKLRIFF